MWYTAFCWLNCKETVVSYCSVSFSSFLFTVHVGISPLSTSQTWLMIFSHSGRTRSESAVIPFEHDEANGMTKPRLKKPRSRISHFIANFPKLSGWGTSRTWMNTLHCLRLQSPSLSLLISRHHGTCWSHSQRNLASLLFLIVPSTMQVWSV